MQCKERGENVSPCMVHSQIFLNGSYSGKSSALVYVGEWRGRTHSDTEMKETNSHGLWHIVGIQ